MTVEPGELLGLQAMGIANEVLFGPRSVTRRELALAAVLVQIANAWHPSHVQAQRAARSAVDAWRRRMDDEVGADASFRRARSRFDTRRRWSHR